MINLQFVNYFGFFDSMQLNAIAVTCTGHRGNSIEAIVTPHVLETKLKYVVDWTL